MQPTPSHSYRIMEIDFLRGIAIILMIIFHLVVDLRDFYFYNLEYLRGFWYLEGKLSAILFIVISGISSTLGRNSIRHGLTIFAWAMLLTVITYLYNDNCYILFGILHFLGISLLTANLMRHLPNAWLLLISSIVIFIGVVLFQPFVTNPYLFPLGLMTNTFVSLDYYPLFPWYGLFLLGILLGKLLYANKKERLDLSQASPTPFELLFCSLPLDLHKTITWLGQHSLIVYLIHQPILLALLYIVHYLISLRQTVFLLQGFL